MPHLREDETPPQGGRPGWAALPNPRIGPWLRLMQKIAVDQGLVPEFEVPFLLMIFFSSELSAFKILILIACEDYTGSYSPWTSHQYTNDVC